MLILHQGTNSIETVRLILRKFTLEDAPDMFHNWASDPEVCKYLMWGPYKEEEAARRRITNWINLYRWKYTYAWAIELKSQDKVIGSISVEIANDAKASCEVGYCLGRDYWSRGIMTEALRAIMHYLFYEVGYQRIYAKYDVLNIASGKVMEKAGMHFLKYEYQVGVRRDGSYFDCAVYEKLITDE